MNTTHLSINSLDERTVCEKSIFALHGDVLSRDRSRVDCKECLGRSGKTALAMEVLDGGTVVCRCGHLGFCEPGGVTSHAGQIGNGTCIARGCPCLKFDPAAVRLGVGPCPGTARPEKSATPNIDALRALVERLRFLLLQPEPGLLSWRAALNRTVRDVIDGKFGDGRPVWNDCDFDTAPRLESMVVGALELRVGDLYAFVNTIHWSPADGTGEYASWEWSVERWSEEDGRECHDPVAEGVTYKSLDAAMRQAEAVVEAERA